MQRDGGRRRASGAAPALRLFACAALSLAAAGCASVNPGAISQALVGPASAPAPDARIAFESLDGAPPEVFHRLVSDLTQEAAARQIAVVPAGGGAPYRIRFYLATHADHGSTTIVWAWDVYDADLHRAVRLGGEERAGTESRKDARGKPAGNQWAFVDEALLRRIASAGMDQMARFIAAGPPPAPETAPPPPPRNGEPVASLDSEGQAAEALAWAPSGPAGLPLPRRRPAPVGPALADATPAR